MALLGKVEPHHDRIAPRVHGRRDNWVSSRLPHARVVAEINSLYGQSLWTSLVHHGLHSVFFLRRYLGASQL